MNKIPAICVMQLCGLLLGKIEKHQAARAAAQAETAQLAQNTKEQEQVLDPGMGWSIEPPCYGHSEHEGA